MSDDRKDLPPVKSPNFLEKVRESLSTYLGNRGNLLDRGITLRDLTDSGIVTLRPGFLSTGRGSPIGGAGSSVAGVYEPDLTPPPTPTGFVATAAISNLLVECDAQTYRQGHGHAKSVLYGASWISGPLPVFTDAVVLTEFGGTVAAHATNPATTWHLWLKWVTVDGVASTVPAGGTNGVVTRTGEDVALLLTALDGKLTDNQLHNDLGARIDLIDGGVPQAVLPYPLAKLAAMQDGLNNQVRMDVDAAASDLLTAVIATSNTRQLVSDAGIYTDPATGVVKIYAMEAANDHLNTVDIRLNAAESNITLKASTAYVDSQIAAAVLSPADLILYDGMDARLASAEVDIDGLQGQIVLKAATFDLNATTARVTTAETEIDSLQGEMALRVTNAEFDSVTNGLDSRVGTAEVALSALGDTSAITSFVQQQSAQAHVDAADATTMLRAILNDDAAARASRGALAFAREDLTAHTNAGIEAEAAQRLELAVAVANNLASFEEEKIVRAGAESALALASETLRARLDSGDYAAVKVQSSASASAVTGLYAQYTVKLDVNSKVSGYGLASTGPTGEGSAFEVRVDKFVIAASAGAAAGFVPFQVLTADTDMGGFIAPAGAYASKAFIQDLQVTNAKIGNLAVDTAKIADLAVATAKIANAAITTAKIGAAQITTALIDTAAITTALIADAAITNAKIENAAVNTIKIADAAISRAKIADLAVDSAKIADAAITSAKIGAAEVDTLNIKGEAVTVPRYAEIAGASGSAFIELDRAGVIVVTGSVNVSAGRNVSVSIGGSVIATASFGLSFGVSASGDTASSGAHFHTFFGSTGGAFVGGSSHNHSYNGSTNGDIGHHHSLSISTTAEATGKTTLALTGRLAVSAGSHTISCAGGDADSVFRLVILGVKR